MLLKAANYFLVFLVYISAGEVSANVTHATDQFWLELKANNKVERNHIVSLGFDIVSVEKDRVIVLASENQLQIAHRNHLVLGSYRTNGVTPFDFPAGDTDFHNYSELSQNLADLATQNSDILELTSLGKTIESREIWSVRLSAQHSVLTGNLPGAVFVGGHHAREHIAMEIPLRLISYLLDQYRKKDTRIVALLRSTEVYVIPMLNPDGADFDIVTGVYQSWRKNRRLNSDRSYGVDLNRNYDMAWGTTGSSVHGSSDTYRGSSAFSEPETLAFKKFIDSHLSIATMISYHTFGENVLWPWSYSDDEVPNAKDLLTFQTMGEKMALQAGYKAMKSGELYLSSGDTCDWAYSAHRIFAFTFELDPQSPFDGGFYPAQSTLDGIFQKNIEPALYLIEAAQWVPSN